MNLLRKDVHDVKRLLALALSLLMALSCMAPATAEEAAPPMDADAYIEQLTELLRGVSKDYAGSWQPVRDESGEYVLSDGSGRDSVRFLRLSLHDGRITAITVSYPWYAENRNASVQQIGLWSTLAAAPIAMQQNLNADEAIDFAGAQLSPVMNGRVGETHTVCGMEATLSLTETAVTVRYTFPGTPDPRILPGDGTPKFDVSAEDYMREFDDMWRERYDQRLVWSAPTPEGDLERIVCATLHSPTLYMQGDRLWSLVAFAPFDPENPNAALINLMQRQSQAAMPLLRLQGMTEDEAEAAYTQWMEAADVRAGIVCAMNGEAYQVTFYGCGTEIRLSESGDALYAVITLPTQPAE